MHLFGLAVLLATLLAGVAIWSPRRVWIKVAALLVAALAIPTAYAAFVDLMGRPKPSQLEWFQADAEDVRVLGSHSREGEVIYLWVQFRGAEEPVAYRLPWDQEAAKQLHEARRETSATGGAIRFRWADRNRSTPGRRLFYSEPQPTSPPKYIDTTD